MCEIGRKEEMGSVPERQQQADDSMMSGKEEQYIKVISQNLTNRVQESRG